MYQVERIEVEIPVEAYVRDYVDVEEFLEACKACPNYNKIWSCPPYDFNPEQYWSRYKDFYIIGVKIIFDQEMIDEMYSPEEIDKILKNTLFAEKKKLTEELWHMESEVQGSMSLSAGSCMLCEQEGCDRIKGAPCRYPEQMRYSIESLGGNVGKTCSKLLGIELEWMTEGKLPNHFTLVSGLFKK